MTPQCFTLARPTPTMEPGLASQNDWHFTWWAAAAMNGLTLIPRSVVWFSSLGPSAAAKNQVAELHLGGSLFRRLFVGSDRW